MADGQAATQAAKEAARISGLKKGDNVVTKGQTYLSDGEEVTIANTAAKTKEKTKTTEKGE